MNIDFYNKMISFNDIVKWAKVNCSEQYNKTVTKLNDIITEILQLKNTLCYDLHMSIQQSFQFLYKHTDHESVIDNYNSIWFNCISNGDNLNGK